MKKDSIVLKNTFIGLLAVAIWSFAALLAVDLTSIPPFELLSCAFLIAFIIVLLRYSISNNKHLFFNFQKRDLLVASTALTVNQLFYYTAFRLSPAAQVDLINYLWPTLLILFSSLLPNKKLCPSYLIACISCLIGVYILLSPEEYHNFSSENLLGYLLAFGAAVSWALYCLYSHYRGSLISSNCISWACGPAALVCFFAHLTFEQFVLPNKIECTLILILGVLQMGFAFYFWERGLKRGCVNFLGLSSYSIPIFSILFLVLFGKIQFVPKMMTAALIISLSPLIPLYTNKIKPLILLFTAQTQKPARLAMLINTWIV